MERVGIQVQLEILEIRKRAFKKYPFSIPTLIALRAQETKVWWMQQPQAENQKITERLVYKAKADNQHKNRHRRHGGF